MDPKIYLEHTFSPVTRTELSYPIQKLASTFTNHAMQHMTYKQSPKLLSHIMQMHNSTWLQTKTNLNIFAFFINEYKDTVTFHLLLSHTHIKKRLHETGQQHLRELF